MPMPSDYEKRADLYFDRYEAMDTTALQALLASTVPAGARVLELGCGSGRDARFLASACRAAVTAVDGSAPLLEKARSKAGSLPLTWHTAVIPADTEALFPAETVFDVVYSCGLFQHLNDHELFQTVTLIDRLCSQTGRVLLLVPLDHQGDQDRVTYTRTALDYVERFERLGFRTARNDVSVTGSPGYECHWATLLFERNEESFRAVKRFRTVIERDAKTATYKLALLRALCDINRTMPRTVRFDNAGAALLPLGLIAERWIRYYWQLAQDGRSPAQITGSAAANDIAFRNELNTAMAAAGRRLPVFHELLMQGSDRTPANDRILSALFQKVVLTLKKGPLQYIRDENKTAVFRTLRRTGSATLTDRTSLLTCYGTVAFPAELWFELNRIAPWLEDAVILEWARVSARFEAAAGRNDPMSAADVVARLLPEQDVRDTRLARELYLTETAAGRLRSVWSRRPLTADRLAVDHMLPWARFHSNDLWNLMPADTRENSRKSDAIPSADALWEARNEITSVWCLLESVFKRRFISEAQSALQTGELPIRGWHVPLFDALLETAELSARQLQAERWP